MRAAKVPNTAQRDAERFDANITRMVRNTVSLSSFHDVAHGSALLRVLSGHIDSLLQKGDGDAMLQACAILDDVPRIKGILTSLERWADVVSKLGPDDVPPEGANRCL